MGIMTTISVIIIAIIFITIIGFGAQGRSELYHILRSKPFSNRTPDAQPAIAMEGGRSRPQPQWGEAGGEPTPQGTTGGRGEPTATTVGRGRGEPTPQGTTGGRGDTMGWGGEGGA